jgi:hypothetical protein
MIEEIDRPNDELKTDPSTLIRFTRDRVDNDEDDDDSNDNSEKR